MSKTVAINPYIVTNLPCPDCGQYQLVSVYLSDQHGSYMHTKYVCTFWRSQEPFYSQRDDRCGWEGWTIPGHDDLDFQNEPLTDDTPTDYGDDMTQTQTDTQPETQETDEHQFALSALDLHAIGDLLDQVEKLDPAGIFALPILLDGAVIHLTVGYDESGTFCLLGVRDEA